jgi:hypothetical protein
VVGRSERDRQPPLGRSRIRGVLRRVPCRTERGAKATRPTEAMIKRASGRFWRSSVGFAEGHSKNRVNRIELKGTRSDPRQLAAFRSCRPSLPLSPFTKRESDSQLAMKRESRYKTSVLMWNSSEAAAGIMQRWHQRASSLRLSFRRRVWPLIILIIPGQRRSSPLCRG